MEIDDHQVQAFKERLSSAVIDIAKDVYGPAERESFWTVGVTLMWLTMGWFTEFYKEELGRGPTSDELMSVVTDLAEGWIKLSQEGEA